MPNKICPILISPSCEGKVRLFIITWFFVQYHVVLNLTRVLHAAEVIVWYL